VALAVMAVLAGIISAAFAHQGASGIVKQRMDKFKQSQQHLKSLIAHAKAGEFDKVEMLAGYLAEWGGKMPSYFPEGSIQKPSEARPEIWLDFEDFTKKAERFRLAANKMGDAARLQDTQALSEAIEHTAASCKSCHNAYRAK